jgi:hypothetical protein
LTFLKIYIPIDLDMCSPNNAGTKIHIRSIFDPFRRELVAPVNIILGSQ